MAESEKRDAILQAALGLIAERGFHNTPMSLVAKQAGASAGTIYHYFAGKDELIHALYQRIKRRFSQMLLVGALDHATPAAQLQQIWLNAFHYYAAHPDEAQFLEQYETSPYWKPTHDVQIGAEVAQLYAMIEELQARGVMKTLPFEVLFELTLGVAIRLARKHVTGSLTLSHAALRSVAESCWQAVAAR